ncbi:transketolase [Pedomonas sp. V897]|uniref:transketolase n=1 Tax=Pedomonas sp. V897 TaxID=3446482 RepID=UPI003EE14D70
MTVSHKDMANAIRALSMDAVEKAKSGHPGMPMGMADVATVLFTRVMKYDPSDSHWADRDRFILSAGHGSMLIYSLLYLTGYERPTIEDIKNFRQLHSPCAGHPEYGELPGVEMTTGPLGQGLATSVGFALAERHLNAQFGDDLVNHYTYVIAGDGCLMEGVSQEAISLAGHLGLGRLIVLWDDNNISIDGPISLASSEDMAKRFEAAGWHVQSVDGHDPEAVEKAIRAAQLDPRPSLIGCKTVIGYGAPNKQGTSATHGSPLGASEVAAAREALGWSHAPFEIPADVLNAWREAGKRGAADRAAWAERLAKAPADVRAEFERRMRGELPANFREAIKAYIDGLIANPQKVATRKASEMALEAINAALPETVGGSADLTGSNNTKTKGQAILDKGNYGGRYIHYGIREFGMAAAMNGLALHGGVIPYGGTFLVFTDYCRPAIRLSAIQHQRVVYVMTHDSIGLGEDGPTHQPIEHLASFRAMPNVKVFRPADAVETAECWQLALENAHGPSILALTRQNVPQVRSDAAENRSARGAYRLRDAANARVTLIATGSEVHIALQAADILAEKGVAADVVSMPSWELFDAQPAEYRRDVLKPGTLKVAVEAASPFGWEKYVGADGLVLGIDRFGASAPAEDLYDFFGLTANKIAEAVTAAL